jgi:hypothetical protein
VKKLTLLVALVAALLAPATASAAPKLQPGLTYTTAATTPFGTTTTATVANLHFELTAFGEICAVFDLTVNGSFEFWTGSEFATYTQSPVPQRIENCQGTDAFRLDLAMFYLGCEAGMFDLTRFTTNASPVWFTGSDGGIYLGSATLEPLVLTAATAEQREAICDLEASLTRSPDKRLVAKLNALLALWA